MKEVKINPEPNVKIDVDNIGVEPAREEFENDSQPSVKIDIPPTGSETDEAEQDAMPTPEKNAPIDIDENDITIADKQSPIVMLFGPRSSGKSMTLVRMSRYLRDNGYVVKVDKTFKSDSKYKEKCEKFMNDLDTKEALSGNAYTDFLLVKVILHGTTVCQFLEAPGEHYFDPKDVSARNFPPYMTEIIRKLRNRKIWIFITEAEWDVNNSMKKAYVRRISNCKQQLVKDSDRFIVLYNKVDQKDELFEDGHLHISQAERLMKEEYEGLARLFANQNPITSLWRKYNYKFVPFCTGYYESKTLKYTESEEMYPRMLWAALMKCLKG